MIITRNGITIRIGLDEMRVLGRATQGVRPIDPRQGQDKPLWPRWTANCGREHLGGGSQRTRLKGGENNRNDAPDGNRCCRRRRRTMNLRQPEMRNTAFHPGHGGPEPWPSPRTSNVVSAYMALEEGQQARRSSGLHRTHHHQRGHHGQGEDMALPGHDRQRIAFSDDAAIKAQFPMPWRSPSRASPRNTGTRYEGL